MFPNKSSICSDEIKKEFITGPKSVRKRCLFVTMIPPRNELSRITGILMKFFVTNPVLASSADTNFLFILAFVTLRIFCGLLMSSVEIIQVYKLSHILPKRRNYVGMEFVGIPENNPEMGSLVPTAAVKWL